MSDRRYNISSLDSVGEIPEIAEIKKQAVKAQQKIVHTATQQMLDQAAQTVPLASSVQGKRIVITGTLSVVRRQAEAVIGRAGGFPEHSVTRHTDYLVVGGKPGSKLRKAKSYGVTIIDQSQLEQMLGMRLR